MIRKTLPFLIFLLSLFSYGLFLSQFNVSIIPDSLTPKNPEHFYDYSGITHIHSIKSSGSGRLMDIVRAAQNSNLDFIFLTDLNQFPYEPIPPQHVNDLIIFQGYEYSYLNSKIINYFPLVPTRPHGLGQTQVLFTELLSQKKRDLEEGIFVISHPLKKDSQWTHSPSLLVDGLEIFNLKKIWQSNWEKEKLSFLWTLILYPFNPRLAFLRLFKEQRGEILLWETFLKRKPTIGFSGADAEAYFSPIPGLHFNLPTYEDIFQITKNHLLLESELTGDYKRDSEKITQAIIQGQFYFSLDLLANPKGFEAFLIDQKGEISPIGAHKKFEPGLKIVVTLPQKPSVPFDVTYYKNGKQLMIANSQHSELTLQEPGTYRVVVRVIPTLPLPDGRKWIPWIYTNPFYIQ